jgi:hypothetical protein
MKIAAHLYDALVAKGRLIHLRLESALVVLFVHDLEKPWKTSRMTKAERGTVRSQKIKEFGFDLTADEWNAVWYCEGENDDYTPRQRVMSPLAALCHCCDVIGARIWLDYPKSEERNVRR